MENLLNITSYNDDENEKDINEVIKITLGKPKEPEEQNETMHKTLINNIKLIYDEMGIYESVPVKTLIDRTKNNNEILRKIALINCENDTSEINFYERKQKINNNGILYASISL